MTPFEEDDNIDFFKRMNAMLEAYRISKSNFPNYFIHNIYPEKDGSLLWGDIWIMVMDHTGKQMVLLKNGV